MQNLRKQSGTTRALVPPNLEHQPSHKIQWLGHAGFRVRINAGKRVFTVYIDPYLSNPMMPENLKREVAREVIPSDANLILITHSHYQHMASAVPLALAATDPDCRLACVPHIAQQILSTTLIQRSKILVLNMGGSADLGYVKITMVHADHCTGAQPMIDSSSGSSGRSGSSGGESPRTANTAALSFSGGAAAGWVISIPQGGPTIYHTGDTNVFSDMALIDSLYRPSHVLLPIGGQCTMGPYEAAFACKNYMPTSHTIIPMHFSSVGTSQQAESRLCDSFSSSCQDSEESIQLSQHFIQTGQREKKLGLMQQFQSELARQGVFDKHIVDSEQEVLGKWLNLIV